MEELLANIERAIAARPGFQDTAVFDEPTAAWGRSATAPTPDAEAFADGRFVERAS
jgi:hypothetical protein